MTTPESSSSERYPMERSAADGAKALTAGLLVMYEEIPENICLLYHDIQTGELIHAILTAKKRLDGTGIIEFQMHGCGLCDLFPSQMADLLASEFQGVALVCDDRVGMELVQGIPQTNPGQIHFQLTRNAGPIDLYVPLRSGRAL